MQSDFFLIRVKWQSMPPISWHVSSSYIHTNIDIENRTSCRCRSSQNLLSTVMEALKAFITLNRLTSLIAWDQLHKYQYRLIDAIKHGT